MRMLADSGRPSRNGFSCRGWRVMLGAWVVVLSGCGAAQEPAGSERDRLSPARLYPMAEGTVWTYDVDTGEGVPTLAISRVVRVEGDQVQVSSGSAPIQYEKRPEGWYKPERGGWLLRAPVRQGATWDAGGGTQAEVSKVDLSVSSLAGEFQACVEVRETGGKGGKLVRTVYCPDVGPVEVESSLSLQVTGNSARVRATLRGYALRGM